MKLPDKYSVVLWFNCAFIIVMLATLYFLIFNPTITYSVKNTKNAFAERIEKSGASEGYQKNLIEIATALDGLMTTFHSLSITLASACIFGLGLNSAILVKKRRELKQPLRRGEEEEIHPQIAPIHEGTKITKGLESKTIRGSRMP